MVNLLFIPLLGIIAIPQIIYLYILLKNKRQFETLEGYVKIKKKISFRGGRYTGRIPSEISGARDLITLDEKLKMEQQKKILHEKFYVKRLRTITIILTICLFIIYIITANVIYQTFGLEATFP